MPTRAHAAVPPPLRWVMWVIPALLVLIGFLHRAAPDVIGRDLMQAFDVTSPAVGLLAAMSFYSYAAYAAPIVPAGQLPGAFGVRRVLAVGLGAALAQGPFGAALDARWSGALADGVRRYPVNAYRAGFAVCAALAAGAALLSLLRHETRGPTIHTGLRGRRVGAEPA